MDVGRRPFPRRAVTLGAAVIAAGALLAGCTLPAPGGPAPLRYRDTIFANVTKTGDLTYGSAPLPDGSTQTLTLDMYRPQGDTQTSRPAVVLVHGGGFRGGDSHNGAMVTVANALAHTGYVAVSINYRLLAAGHICSQENPPSQTCIDAALAAQHDAQAAVRWLRKNATTYGVDPTRIGIEGGSAGAVTALAVGVHSDDPGDSGNPGFSSKVGGAAAISGEIPHSFAGDFGPDDSPELMFNGTADETVPFAKGVQTAADLYNAHVPVIFEPLEGGGHVPMAQFGGTIVSQSVYFFYDVLDLAHAAGQPAAAAKAFEKQAAPLARKYPRMARQLRNRRAGR